MLNIRSEGVQEFRSSDICFVFTEFRSEGVQEFRRMLDMQTLIFNP